jgi:Chaperone of endosialidase
VKGSNNIDISSGGTTDEFNTIRIGTNGTQMATYIAGIFGQRVGASSGVPVVVDNTGKLGVILSSVRYKHDIHDMGGASAGLMKLRPVSFRYKDDPSGTLHYGLVAEEVARVYPELVTRGPDGKVQSVRYLEFIALLLNELQKQHNLSQAQATELQKQTEETRELAQQLGTKDQQLASQQREIEALKQQNASINALSERLAALEQQVRTSTAQRFRSLASK